MNKILLIGLLAVGFVILAHADVEQNPVPSHEEEVLKTATIFINVLETCKAKKYNPRKCEDKIFRFAEQGYTTNSCAVDCDAFDRIYKGTCPEDLPSNPEDCVTVKRVYDRLKWTCQSLKQMKK